MLQNMGQLNLLQFKSYRNILYIEFSILCVKKQLFFKKYKTKNQIVKFNR